MFAFLVLIAVLDLPALGAARRARRRPRLEGLTDAATTSTWKKHPRGAWVGIALVAVALVAAAVRADRRSARRGCASRISRSCSCFLALGLNIVVGFAGLLDLGYIAFYAVGAYVYALLASPHFNLHLPFWIILPIGAAVACLFGVLLGAPTLKLRGDYLAIVTLGFGEIIRIFLNNLSQPVNITNGPQGITLIDPFRIGGFNFGQTETIGGLAFTGPIKYYYLLLVVLSSPSSSSTCACRTRASAARGRRSARTRSRRARWASTRAT